MLRAHDLPDLNESTEVAALDGDLDLEHAPALRRTLRELLGRGSRTVVVDLRRVSFLDSSGLAALIDAHRAAHADGRRFLLIKPKPLIWRTTFVTTGLTRIFEAVDAPERVGV